MNTKKHILNNLVIATKNRGKLQEMREILSDVVSNILTADDLRWESPEETGTTFAENAYLKAKYVATTTGLPALGDDSGICITKLNGAPNIFSARWADDERGFVAAIERVERELNGIQSDATFKSVVSLCFPDGNHFEFEGELHGNIIFPPQGATIGYESIFVPDGHSCSLSSLPSKTRQQIHYRTKAVEKLKKFLKNGFCQ